jgi:hypothetical protein
VELPRYRIVKTEGEKFEDKVPVDRKGKKYPERYKILHTRPSKQSKIVSTILAYTASKILTTRIVPFVACFSLFPAISSDGISFVFLLTYICESFF